MKNSIGLLLHDKELSLRYIQCLRNTLVHCTRKQLCYCNVSSLLPDKIPTFVNLTTLLSLADDVIVNPLLYHDKSNFEAHKSIIVSVLISNLHRHKQRHPHVTRFASPFVLYNTKCFSAPPYGTYAQQPIDYDRVRVAIRFQPSPIDHPLNPSPHL